MQIKVTKRFSHGFEAQGNYTWAKGLVIGSSSDSTYYLTGQAVSTDIYNYGINKQINQYVRPQAMTVTFSYTTPKFSASEAAMKVLSQAARDWQIGAVLRYQSGAFIGLPASNNQLTTQLGRTNPLGFTNNFGNNYWNLTGQPILNVDPNCRCFNPQTATVFNSGAFVDAPPGQWSTSAPFYQNLRWQRQPAESVSLARNFRVKERMNLQIRAEFFNIFNRVFYALPALTNPNLPTTTAVYAGNSLRYNTGGFGSITTIGTGQGAQPRNGQIVAKFTF